MIQNLEALIKEHAEMMAEQMLKAVEWAGSEEDIRHECNKLIDEFVKKAGLPVKGLNEYVLVGGRIDSKYGRVVIEYKNPKGAGKITENKNAPGAKAVVEQIQKRFQDLYAKEHVGMERIFGVGCDGDTLVFVRMRGNKFDVEDPQSVTPHTVERLLRAIVSLGARGLSFTPENLAGYFGSESKSAQEGVRLIHDLIHGTDNPKAQTFFHQWQILFGEVCGYDIHGQNAKINKLAEHYLVPAPNPAELLFAVHTYYALFIKLLAAEIVTSFAPLGTSPLKNLVAAPTSAKLLEDLRNLEQGGIWSQLGIRNFLEGDLFAWYLDAWDERCADAVRAMAQSLDQFDPTTLSVDPTESRDLLKQLYHQLFPRSVRHDLGEYYTPDWLAELVLNELGYDGNPDKRLLDPACGSGTFLVMALNRVKIWYEEHRHECGFGEDELLRKVLRNIIGFDLNPLAVMAARTNYLMAIRDLLRHAGNVELPVYLCDSIMMPHVAGSKEAQKVFLSESATAYDLDNPPIALRTAPRIFLIPREITTDREHLGRYADTLEFCVRNRYSPEEFLERCNAEGIPVTEAQLHEELYGHLRQLDTDNKNGVWARIIKNAFAPLFVGKVDYVAGNPPWVNWENLPEDYRDGMKPLWQEYGLFTLSGSAGRLGGGKKDLSMLFVYSAVDNYLDSGGRLGFVITQSVFKTQGAGDGFRQLRFSKGRQTFYLKPVEVKDLSAMQVFEGATNRTAVFVCEKRTRAFSYPVSYSVWRGPSRISQEVSVAEATALVTASKLGALPVDPNEPSSPWLTAPEGALSGIQKVIGKSDYKAYEGVNTGGLNGCFWIRIIDTRPNGDLLIENLHDVGKIKVKQVQGVIEPDLVYPLLRGRDVQRWHAEPSAQIILAQDPETRRGIPESTMKRRYPKTYAYLKQFEGDAKNPARGTLRGRALYRSYYEPSDPFYSMYNVGPYTMAKWKVVWREQSSFFQAAFAGSESKRALLPDHKLMMVACSSQDEADFLLGMLNSNPSLLAIHSYVISTSTSTHVLGNVAVPNFVESNSKQREVGELSRQCQAAAAKGDGDIVAELEAEIDRAAAKIWGITDDELRAIQDALTEMNPGKAVAELADGRDDD
ncbi:MAG: N-6 DNA methylase [Candidatus Sumerlaeota bacterium]|nr:N-6 DNA methylase [Candidatus Sumerlaeota bacterium]